MKATNTIATLAVLATLVVANHAKAASPTAPMTPMPGVTAKTSLFQTASSSSFGRYCKDINQFQKQHSACIRRGRNNLYRCNYRGHQSRSACKAFYEKFVPQCLKAACGMR